MATFRFNDAGASKTSAGSWKELFIQVGIQPAKAIEYEELFNKNGIDQSLLADLDQHILDDIGVSIMGDRLKILKLQRAITTEQQNTSSGNNPTSSAPVASNNPPQQATTAAAPMKQTTVVKRTSPPPQTKQTNNPPIKQVNSQSTTTSPPTKQANSQSTNNIGGNNQINSPTMQPNIKSSTTPPPNNTADEKTNRSISNPPAVKGVVKASGPPSSTKPKMTGPPPPSAALKPPSLSTTTNNPPQSNNAPTKQAPMNTPAQKSAPIATVTKPDVAVKPMNLNTAPSMSKQTQSPVTPMNNLKTFPGPQQPAAQQQPGPKFGMAPSKPNPATKPFMPQNSGVSHDDDMFLCKKCNREIDEAAVSTKGANFHPECFACGSCDKQLQPNGHYLKLFDSFYHKECLRCSICFKNLASQEFFTSKGMFYCEECNLLQIQKAEENLYPSPKEGEPWASLQALDSELKLASEYEMTANEFTIGRLAECDIQISTDVVSSTHCKIMKEVKATGTSVYVLDNSINGTFLNGVLLGKGTKAQLYHKDVISLPFTNATSLKAALKQSFVFKVLDNKKKWKRSVAAQHFDFGGE